MSEPTDTDESESDGESALSYNQNNTNAMKHGLYADREILFDALEGDGPTIAFIGRGSGPNGVDIDPSRNDTENQ